jgi:hypothetical protein
MTFAPALIEVAVEARYRTTIEPTLPTQYENLHFDPGSHSLFAAMQVQHDTRQPSAIVGDGLGRPRNVGSLEVQIYARKDEGGGAAMTAATLVANSFDAKTVTTTGGHIVIFKAAEVRKFGSQPYDGQEYYRVDVSCPFYCDEE